VPGICPRVGEFSQTSMVRVDDTGAKSPVPVRTVTVANRETRNPSHAKKTNVSVPDTMKAESVSLS
jgi:hypothetical protein